MILGIHHVALSTPDLERLRTFYCDLLGFQEVSRVRWPAGTTRINQVMGLEDSAATTVMLQAGNLCLELFQFELPRAPIRTGDRPVHHHGITHLCLDVSDVQAEYQRLSAAGMRFHCPPQDFGTARATYGRDPDGNVLELQEIVVEH